MTNTNTKSYNIYEQCMILVWVLIIFRATSSDRLSLAIHFTLLLENVHQLINLIHKHLAKVTCDTYMILYVVNCNKGFKIFSKATVYTL